MMRLIDYLHLLFFGHYQSSGGNSVLSVEGVMGCHSLRWSAAPTSIRFGGLLL